MPAIRRERRALVGALAKRQLPHLPGGPEAQFWWVLGMMFAISAAMLWVFRRMKWL